MAALATRIVDSAAMRRSKVMVALVVLACGGAAQLACGSDRGSSSPVVMLDAAPPAARESPDPRPAIPIIEVRAAASGNDASTAINAGHVSNADRVVAGLRKRFRACYQRGLAENAKMQGRVLLSVKVSPDGTVLTVTPGPVEGLSPRVVTCVSEVVKAAPFNAPGGIGATLQVPVAFETPRGAPRKPGR